MSREAMNHIADLKKEPADCRSKQAADGKELRSEDAVGSSVRRT